MPGQRWEIVAIASAILLQIVYQSLYTALPDRIPKRLLSVYDRVSQFAEKIQTPVRDSAEEVAGSSAKPVYWMLQEHSFDGSGKCVDHDLGSSSDLPLAGSQYTIEAWVMPKRVRPNESFGIVGWGEPSPNQLNGLILFRAANSLRNVWWQNDLQALSDISLADGKYHHVAATWDGNLQTITVDFEVVASRASTGYSAKRTDTFCVGRAWHQDGTYANFRGKIKDLKIWKFPRTISDMRKDANLTEGVAQSQRVFYRVHTARGFLNIHTEAGDPFQMENVVGRWNDGDIFEAISDIVETQYGPWVRSSRGWSIVKHEGFEFLKQIEDLSATPSGDLILDDTDGHATGLWHRGVYKPCLVDAYNGMFHHDWAQQKGQQFGKYPFGPMSSGGCFAVDEWHPGGVGACAFYLTHVPVEVTISGAQVASFIVDQSTAGGRWNMLGYMDMPGSSVGEIRTSNNGTTTGCQAKSAGAGECFWVADAFRLRRVGNTCDSVEATAGD